MVTDFFLDNNGNKVGDLTRIFFTEKDLLSNIEVVIEEPLNAYERLCSEDKMDIIMEKMRAIPLPRAKVKTDRLVKRLDETVNSVKL